VNLQSLFDWLLGLPPELLLPAMGILAVLENVFPPIPADVLIALGAFIAARNDNSPIPAFLVILIGNVLGAMAVYAVARRYGAAWTERRFHLRHKADADESLAVLYARYGLLALFVGRFIPGVRAVVAPFAGALRASIPGTVFAVTVASGVWYGLVTWVAFRAGTNWEELVRTIGRLGKWAAFLAAVVAVGIVFAWRARRRRRAAGSSHAT
jgi:membrane protein DedA with SNARE-associated domain